MTQKSEIQEMLSAGKGYDEIEDKTGSNRSYIRSIAVDHRKGAAESEISEKKEGEEQPSAALPENPGMNFVDDAAQLEVKTEAKTGLDHHKAWVKAAKYECGGCGATVGRSTDFCPHCGKSLSWEGIE